MRIYTRSGDDGTTTGYDGESYNKDDYSIELVGTLDELLADLDAAIVRVSDDQASFLEDVQTTLWQTAAEISLGEPGKQADDPLTAEDIERLEDYIDEHNPEVSDFIRYRTKPGAATNQARVTCRRLERRLTPALREDDVRPVVYEYFNRLSDALYVVACQSEDALRRHKD